MIPEGTFTGADQSSLLFINCKLDNILSQTVDKAKRSNVLLLHICKWKFFG